MIIVPPVRLRARNHRLSGSMACLRNVASRNYRVYRAEQSPERKIVIVRRRYSPSTGFVRRIDPLVPESG